MIAQWMVWVPERGETEDDARQIGGLDAEDAARNLAERMCSDDPDNYATFVDRGGLTMHVRPCPNPLYPGENEVTVLCVTGEASVTFMAVEKEVRRG